MPASDEALRESIARLEQALHAEREQRREAEGLLAGLAAVARATTRAEAEPALLSALAPVFTYEAAAVFVADGDGYRVSTATGPALTDLRLGPGPLLRRVESGQPSAVFDVAKSPELASFAEVAGVRSALLVPLLATGYAAILVGVHSRRAAFSPRQLTVARGFAHNVRGVLESFAVREREHEGRLAAERAAMLERSAAALQERVDEIERQKSQILRLTGPVLRVWPEVVAVPIVGALDDAQLLHVSERLLDALSRTRARAAILDLTGIEALDHGVAERLRALHHAVRLIGARCLISGVSPALAASLVESGLDPHEAESFSSLADALGASIRTLRPRRSA